MWRGPASIRVLPVAALCCVGVGLTACGATRSTLPPRPSAHGGFVPLLRLANDPEVYADATVSTSGTVERAGRNGFRLASPGVTTPIALDPPNLAKPLLGKHVDANGIYTVSFQAGYELLLNTITPTSGATSRSR
jgi:hypothetical protein